MPGAQEDASEWALTDGPAAAAEPDEWSDPKAGEQSDKAERKQGRERAHRRPEPMRTGGKLADLEQRLERLEAAGAGSRRASTNCAGRRPPTASSSMPWARRSRSCGAPARPIRS